MQAANRELFSDAVFCMAAAALHERRKKKNNDTDSALLTRYLKHLRPPAPLGLTGDKIFDAVLQPGLARFQIVRGTALFECSDDKLQRRIQSSLRFLAAVQVSEPPYALAINLTEPRWSSWPVTDNWL